MMIGSTRYSSDDVAIAPPVTPPDSATVAASISAMSTACGLPSRNSSGPPTNAEAVMSVNATMM